VVSAVAISLPLLSFEAARRPGTSPQHIYEQAIPTALCFGGLIVLGVDVGCVHQLSGPRGAAIVDAIGRGFLAQPY
jgi:hypothetical protein